MTAKSIDFKHKEYSDIIALIAAVVLAGPYERLVLYVWIVHLDDFIKKSMGTITFKVKLCGKTHISNVYLQHLATLKGNRFIIIV